MLVCKNLYFLPFFYSEDEEVVKSKYVDKGVEDEDGLRKLMESGDEDEEEQNKEDKNKEDQDPDAEAKSKKDAGKKGAGFTLASADFIF